MSFYIVSLKNKVQIYQWVHSVMVMVFNVNFNNISVISWRSVLLLEKTGENHGPVASHWQTLSHNVVSSTPRLIGIRTHNVVHSELAFILAMAINFFLCKIWCHNHNRVRLQSLSHK